MLEGKTNAPLQQTCLALLGTCAEGVHFYCSSLTYPAISNCTIFPFSVHCEEVQETNITQTKYKCDLCEYIAKEPTDVIWHHLECHFEST